MRTQKQWEGIYESMKSFVRMHKKSVWIVPTENEYRLSIIKPTPDELPIGTRSCLYDQNHDVVEVVDSVRGLIVMPAENPLIVKARTQAKGLHSQGNTAAAETMQELASSLAEAAAKQDALLAQLRELLEVTKGYQEWIKAVPDATAASLPAMPGIDGDWAEEVMDEAKRTVSAGS